MHKRIKCTLALLPLAWLFLLLQVTAEETKQSSFH